MKITTLPLWVRLCCCLALTAAAQAQETGRDALKSALTLHAPFDADIHAAFSTGEKTAYVKKGKELVPAQPNDEVRIVADAGKFGGALHFPKKGATRPQFSGQGVLGYNDKDWSATVSAWLRITPDEDLEPGYCDPIQIVGNDSKKGFIFLEWSKDETPRYFRFAIRPLLHIWDPGNVGWAAIPFEKRPMVQVERAPFSREKWTHVAFTLEHINSRPPKPRGSLFINGKAQGRIENWDLKFDWDPASVALVLGASYVGHIDDLAVFGRALTDAEVAQVFALEGGIADLRK